MAAENDSAGKGGTIKAITERTSPRVLRDDHRWPEVQRRAEEMK
jgi:polyphosphate kinase 2 (PPK2 family)